MLCVPFRTRFLAPAGLCLGALVLLDPSLAAQCGNYGGGGGGGGGNGGPPPPGPGVGLTLPGLDPGKLLPRPGLTPAPGKPTTPGDTTTDQAPGQGTTPGFHLPAMAATPRRPAGTATTGGGVPIDPTLYDWQLWWELNRDAYLPGLAESRARAAVTEGSVTSGSSAEARASEASGGAESSLAEHVRPILEAAWEARDARTRHAAARALARIGAGAPAREAIEGLLREGDAGARAGIEVLAHQATPGALTMLLDLSGDRPAGRKLLGRDGEIPESLRAFATYGLAVLSERQEKSALSAMIARHARTLLDEHRNGQADLQAAAVTVLGLVRLEDDAALRESLVGVLTDDERPRGVRAQAPIALARRAAASRSQTAQQQVVIALLEALDDKKTPTMVQQSCAQALGVVAPADSAFGARVAGRLQQLADDAPDISTRHFALIALGEQGGAAGAQHPLVESRILPFLLRRAQKGKSIERPWAALALGICGARSSVEHHARLPRPVGLALYERFEDSGNSNERAAFALALGLIGFEDAKDDLHDASHDTSDALVLSHLSLALGLLGAAECRNDFATLILRAGGATAVARDAALACELVRAESLRGWLAERLEDYDELSLPEIESAAFALRYVGEEDEARAVAARLAAAEDGSLGRAALCAAIGAIADEEWRVRRSTFAHHLNPHALPPALYERYSGTGFLSQL